MRPYDRLCPQEKLAASLVHVKRAENLEPLAFLYFADRYLFLAPPLRHLEDLDVDRALPVRQVGRVGPALALLVCVGENFALDENFLASAFLLIKPAHLNRLKFRGYHAVAVNDLFLLLFLFGKFRGYFRFFLLLFQIVLAAEVAGRYLHFANKPQTDREHLSKRFADLGADHLIGGKVAVHFQKNIVPILQDVMLLYESRLVAAHGESVIDDLLEMHPEKFQDVGRAAFFVQRQKQNCRPALLRQSVEHLVQILTQRQRKFRPAFILRERSERKFQFPDMRIVIDA